MVETADIPSMIETAQNASDVLKALSNEHRLLILCLLSEGEKSVSDLENILSMPQPAVSQQLARLRFDHLVSTRRDGRTVYYSLANEDITQLVTMLYEFFCKPARAQLESNKMRKSRVRTT